jgi:hypothetical protein
MSRCLERNSRYGDSNPWVSLSRKRHQLRLCLRPDIPPLLRLLGLHELPVMSKDWVLTGIATHDRQAAAKKDTSPTPISSGNN